MDLAPTRLSGVSRSFRRDRRASSLLGDERGTVTILGALMLTALLGFASLVAEFGVALERQTENQRVADVTAFAAANYYASNSGSSSVLATATTVAQNLAALNGVPAADVTVGYGASPANASNSAVSVQIKTVSAQFLAPLLGGRSSLSVPASAYAQIGAQTSACITALSAATGIVLSGGVSISAPACGLATNATLTVPCGTSISAKSVSYGGSAPSQPCNGVTTSTLAQKTTTDPLASSAGVIAGQAHVPSVAALTAPAAPTATSGSISFNLGYWPTSNITSGACVASFSGSTWTIACPAGGTYNFSSLIIAGGITVQFNPGGSAASTYVFTSNFNNTGTAVVFGPGNYTFAQGLTAGGGSATTFAAGGTFTFGPGASNCNGAGNYSVCAMSNISFNGASAFSISNGVYVGGGETVAMGSGTNNSFRIGPASDGNALWLGGGAHLTLGGATGTSSLFQIVGNVNASSGGGSCMTLGAAAQHDINGWFSTAGGTILGAGVYTINGYLAFGENGGGSVLCNGATVGLQGSNVTIVYSAATTTIGCTCNNDGLCFANGFNYVSLTAPTSGTMAGLLFVGPPASNSAGALFTGGSGAQMSGAFYMPGGAFQMSGGASINTPSGGCLQIVAQSISLSGGTTAASNCVSGGGGGSTSPTLVQ